MSVQGLEHEPFLDDAGVDPGARDLSFERKDNNHRGSEDDADNGANTGRCACTCCLYPCWKKFSEKFDIVIVFILSTPLFISLWDETRPIATVVWHMSALLNATFACWWHICRKTMKFVGGLFDEFPK